MAQHISVRVPWKDNGYDGRVCQSPCHNTACLRLKNIAENKNDALEESLAEMPIKGHEKDIPCLSEGGVFMSATEHSKVTIHPYKKSNPKTHGHFCETTLTFPPFSLPARPFAWTMRRKNEDKDNVKTLALRHDIDFVQDKEPELSFETNWVQDAENQRAIFEAFFRDVTPNQSLVLPYAKQVPFIEDSKRVIMGIGYISQIIESVEHNTNGVGRLRSITWETMLQHTIRNDRQNGFLFPYKEMMDYAHKNPEFDIKTIAVFADDSYFDEFSYATEHVSYDAVISILLQALKSLRIIKNCISGNWDECIEWVKLRLKEVWEDRGIFPGAGTMLSALGLPCGGRVVNEIKKIATDKDNFIDLFEKSIENPEKYFTEKLATIIQRSSIPIVFKNLNGERKELFWLLARCTLSCEQADAIFNNKCNINCSTENILDNLYSIYEQTRSLESKYQISLQKIDMALLPPRELSEKYPLTTKSSLKAENDERRVRAFIIYILESQTAYGHTVYPENNLISAIKELVISPELTITPDLLSAYRDFISLEVISMGMKRGGTAYQLKRFSKISEIVRKSVEKRIYKGARHNITENWKNIVESAHLKYELTDTQERAKKEQIAILEELAASRLSVLVGCAGTGKTTLLSLLCKSSQIANGGILLLAPTGKARVRMSQAMQQQGISFEALTVAQFLFKNGGYDSKTMCYHLLDTPTKCSIGTVIIDESSMLTEEMFGALLQSLKSVGRIIFVGDPNQLPPIGAGRPFVDLVNYLNKNILEFPRVGKSFGELTIIHRQEVSDAKCMGINLAEWFTDSNIELDTEVFNKLQEGEQLSDLKFKKWETVSDLENILLETIAEESGMSGVDDIDGFDISLGGIPNGEWMNFGNNPEMIESWQVLSAYRNNPEIGTAILNRHIHNKYRKYNEINAKYKRRSTKNPLGVDGIIFGDKVINIRNKTFKDGYPAENCLNYVANGEVGIVERIWQRPTAKKNSHQIRFSSQPNHSYNWSSIIVDEGTSEIELAYALTVHKAQGSEFKKIILVLGKHDRMLSRELLYTAITRQKEKLIILSNEDAYKLKNYTGKAFSDVASRFTSLFESPDIIEHKNKFYESGLIHKTARGELVRSKSEVIIADALFDKGITYEYEKELYLGEDGFRIPDFTIDDAESGNIYYWEHCGMMHNASYRKRWECKKALYEKHNIIEGTNLIVTYESDGAIDSAKIREIIEDILE